MKPPTGTLQTLARYLVLEPLKQAAARCDLAAHSWLSFRDLALPMRRSPKSKRAYG